MDIHAVLRMFGVSSTGYYNWLAKLKRKKSPDYDDKKEEDEKKLKEMVLQIIRRLGYVPGARGLRVHLWRNYMEKVSRKHAAKLLRSMNLTANRPHKDPYKHQATHDHEYSAPVENLLDRNFFEAPRSVILTDITYLSFGYPRNTFYTCVFRDAYTRENLGWQCSQRMTVEDLVRPAYEIMMQAHGSELKSVKTVLIHSDQGSQYLSTDFRRLLSDDDFVQSVSRRGNALDNSPMESFFSRMKTHIMDLVALAPDFETASALVDGYMRDYNEKNYQDELAGLTPVEFYRYCTTGIYPCEEYFGVDAGRLLTPDQLIARRKAEAEKRAVKARLRAEKNGGCGKDPVKVVLRDIRILEKNQKKSAEDADAAKKQGEKLSGILKKAEKALEYVRNAAEEVKAALWHGSEWKKHPQLDYIYDMQGMF